MTNDKMQAELNALRDELAMLNKQTEQLEQELQQEREATANLVQSIQEEWCLALMQERNMLAACFVRCAAQHSALS